MGLMDEAIKETIKDKDFKKTDLKKLATRNKQIGGDHYKNFKIQPIEYIEANDLTYSEGNVIKYIVRAKRKNDTKKYLKKSLWYIQRMLDNL